MRRELDVGFNSLTTPIGKVFVAVSDRGVCDITFGCEHEARYRRRLTARGMVGRRDRKAVELMLSELDEYFAGTRTRFTVPVDLRAVPPFAARVLRMIRRISFGRMLSYGEIARRIDAPRASRAVGGALGRNPVPIIVPCHRVVAHDGGLGGFTGGLALKRALLRLEGCATGRDRLTVV